MIFGYMHRKWIYILSKPVYGRKDIGTRGKEEWYGKCEERKEGGYGKVMKGGHLYVKKCSVGARGAAIPCFSSCWVCGAFFDLFFFSLACFRLYPDGGP